MFFLTAQGKYVGVSTTATGAKASLPGSAGWCGNGGWLWVGAWRTLAVLAFFFPFHGIHEFGQPTLRNSINLPSTLYEFSLYKTLTTRYGDFGEWGLGWSSGDTGPLSSQQTQLCILLLQAFFFWMWHGMDGIGSGTLAQRLHHTCLTTVFFFCHETHITTLFFSKPTCLFVMKTGQDGLGGKMMDWKRWRIRLLVRE